MSELVVIAYPEETRAQEVMRALPEMRKATALDLEDAVQSTCDGKAPQPAARSA